MEEILIIEAQKKDELQNVSGMAYGGGKLKLFFWEDPFVVDLEGMSIPANVPLLLDHRNEVTARLGVLNPVKDEKKLSITGIITAANDTAKEVIEQGKKAPWQMSIGAEIHVLERVEKGSRIINGRKFTAPFIHAKKTTLREVSVVSVGVDKSTRMRVSASCNFLGFSKQEASKLLEEKKNMTEEKKEAVEASLIVKKQPDIDIKAMQAKAIEAERKRIVEIKKICAGKHTEIETQAIEAGSNPSEVALKVLEALRASRPANNINISVKNPMKKTELRGVLEASLSLRAGIDAEKLSKEYGEKVVEAAGKEPFSLKEVIVECCRMEGKTIPRSFGNDTIKAGFSTVTLPGILNNVADKRLLRSFNAQNLVAPRLCTASDINDFKLKERYRLTDTGDLLPLAPDGEIQHSGLTEEKATNQLKTYAKKLVLTREMIINNDLDSFMRILDMFGVRAARKIDQLFFTRLLNNPTMDDGNAIFSAAHNNYLTGAATALDADSLKSALKDFLDQVDADNQPIAVMPKFLLVPNDLKWTAVELTQSQNYIMAGDTDLVRPAMNSLALEGLIPLSSPYLSNTAFNANASTKAWYLWADPMAYDTFEIGYLQGRRAPTVESGDVDYNHLGMWFRVYFDLGVREQDWRGVGKRKGEA